MVEEIAEEKETVLVNNEDVDIWPRWCVREELNCRQCYMEGKIPCSPRFRKGWVRPEAATPEYMLRQGMKTPEIHRKTGVPTSTIYAIAQRLHRAGVLIRRSYRQHPADLGVKIVEYVRLHPDEMYKEVAERFNVDPCFVSKHCTNAGINRRKILAEKMKLKVGKAREILKANPSRSLESIANEIGIAGTTIAYHLRLSGVVPLTHTMRLAMDSLKEEIKAVVREALGTGKQKEVMEIYTIIGNYFGHDSDLKKAEQALRDISKALKECKNADNS